MLLLTALIFFAKSCLCLDAPAYSIKFWSHGGSCQVLSEGFTQQRDMRIASLEAVHIESQPSQREVEPFATSSEAGERVTETTGHDVDKVWELFQRVCPFRYEEFDDSPFDNRTEVRTIVDNGPPENRIDVVFMGDGYLVSEKQKFFQDISRLTKDMFEGPTFSSKLPLFNIWAVFVPSQESGIGVGGKPKKTAFGLYRDGTELRGVYCSRPARARKACRLTGNAACDYPTLIANDDYYGGLGGEFTIATKSERSGSVVLRHEFGHNFIDVGEEYDNGFVYSGVNSKETVKSSKWDQWLNSTKKREERAIQRILEYPWYDLKEGPWVANFTSDGQYSRWLLQISVSGVEVEKSISINIDGKELEWSCAKTLDRSFIFWKGETKFIQGSHSVEIKETIQPTHPRARQLCSITLHEYGSEDEFEMDNTYISAYPTWDINGVKRYRPTNEGCLMRNMSQPTFCSVCKEGMWRSFLSKINLIDEVVVSPVNPQNHIAGRVVDLLMQQQITLEKEKDNIIKVQVKPIPLAHFRNPALRVEDEEYTISWYYHGKEMKKWRNQFEMIVTRLSSRGKWEVVLTLKTPEVRFDPKQVLTSRKSFVIS